MSNAANHHATLPAPVRSRGLWFGMLGGAIAWLFHLIGAAILAEWGCMSGWGRMHWGGISAVAWAISLLSLVMLLIASAATWVAYRHYQRLRRECHAKSRQDDSRSFLAEAGWKSSAIFTGIVLAESVPILFFLSEC